jgi:DNA-directed RNA polymerase specialized sigma24 family protein
MVSRYKYEMSFIDMAKQFNLPETTIKSKVYKSLETLKKKFNK